MAEIVVRSLKKRFTADCLAIADVSITIPDGELLTIIGPSGSGKTTLLRAIAGLETPDAGTIQFDGVDVTRTAPADRNVAMVFQRDSLWPHLTVRQNLLFGSRAGFGLRFWTMIANRWRTPKKCTTENADIVQHETRALELARWLKIDDRLDRYPHELSGGESQRVAIGRALMRRPNLLLMDEPFAHLDQPTRRQLARDFQVLQEQRRVTTIFVSHDQREASMLGHRLAFYFGGKIQLLGPPNEVFRSPNDFGLASILGDPPMNVFRGCLTRENGVTRYDGIGWRVEWTGDHGAEWTGQGVAIGFRPEDAGWFGSPEFANQPVAVFHGSAMQYEPMHTTGGLAHVTIGEKDTLTIFTRANDFADASSHMRVAVPVERIQFFELDRW